MPRVAPDCGCLSRLSSAQRLLLTLLLPMLVSAWVVTALQKETGPSSPLVSLLGIAMCLSAVLIVRADRRRSCYRRRHECNREVAHAVRIGSTIRPGRGAALAIALSLIAGLLTLNAVEPVLAVLAWIAALILLLGHAALQRRVLQRHQLRGRDRARQSGVSFLAVESKPLPAAGSDAPRR